MRLSGTLGAIWSTGRSLKSTGRPTARAGPISKTEFLASTDNWFRPVNFANTPEGTLLILDMYRETIEHPFSIPEPIKKHLDLTSGRDRGRLYALVHSEAESSPAAKSRATQPRKNLWSCWPIRTPGGVRRPNGCCSSVRTARWHLRCAAMVKQRPNALGRLHALWTLELLSSLDAASIELGLADPEPRVREAAIRLAEARLEHEPALLVQALALAGDPDPMVRFQLAFRSARSRTTLA